jgi:hypothetical protein
MNCQYYRRILRRRTVCPPGIWWRRSNGRQCWWLQCNQGRHGFRRSLTERSIHTLPFRACGGGAAFMRGNCRHAPLLLCSFISCAVTHSLHCGRIIGTCVCHGTINDRYQACLLCECTADIVVFAVMVLQQLNRRPTQNGKGKSPPLPAHSEL